jgi:alpha-D-xyloside xylohydrolase
VTITTAKLKLKINKATNAITYCDLSGKVITAEASSNKSMSPATIAGIKRIIVSTAVQLAC